MRTRVVKLLGANLSQSIKMLADEHNGYAEGFLERGNFDLGVKDLVLTVVVTDPTLYNRDNLCSYDRRRKELTSSARADFETMMNGTRREKFLAYHDALCAAVSQIDANLLPQPTKGEMLATLEEAAQAVLRDNGLEARIQQPTADAGKPVEMIVEGRQQITISWDTPAGVQYASENLDALMSSLSALLSDGCEVDGYDRSLDDISIFVMVDELEQLEPWIDYLSNSQTGAVVPQILAEE